MSGKDHSFSTTHMHCYNVEFEHKSLDFLMFKTGTESMDAEPLSKVLKELDKSVDGDKYNLYMYVYAYSEDQVRDMFNDYEIVAIDQTD